MREIWIVSSVPPPVHGVSAFNATLRDWLDKRGVASRMFRVGTRGPLTELERFSVRKLVGDAGTLARLAFAGARRGNGRPVVYFTPSQAGTAVMRDAAVASIARASGTALVAHIHGCMWLDSWERGGWQARMMFDALRGCARIICLGESFARRMAAATGLPCVGVNNGVLAPITEQRRSPPRQGEPIKLLYLSNLKRSKGLWTAARALRELLASGLPARLRCAGGWSREQARAEFVRDFKGELADRTIELVGFADGDVKRQLFRDAHFFVLPTEYPPEGQPLSLIEAMASGLIPVTTRQGAIPDLLGFEGSEQLASAEHRDHAAVARTITALASDPVRYERVSAMCFERYRRALTIDDCADAVLRILLDA
jgi:glycosyltransferase involved in cell wall biosynthesis